jgi:hypothetical protein
MIAIDISAPPIPIRVPAILLAGYSLNVPPASPLSPKEDSK